MLSTLPVSVLPVLHAHIPVQDDRTMDVSFKEIVKVLLNNGDIKLILDIITSLAIFDTEFLNYLTKYLGFKFGKLVSTSSHFCFSS